ncbi:MAG: hypothetical protein ACRD5M_06030 [Candidatus Acidiferrales bacterium]
MRANNNLNRLRIPEKALLLGTLLILSLMISPSVKSQNSDGLQQLLTLTQTRVEHFVEQYSEMRYEEDILQQKLKGDERVEYKRETVFDSLLRTRFEGGHLLVDEQRLVQKSPAHVDQRPLLSTSGFSTLAMIFHPYYERSFHFTRAQDESVQGKILAAVHFDHIQGTSSPILYQMVGAEKPLELTGTAWIDPGSGEISRIEITANSAASDMGVKIIHAELNYGPVKIEDEPQPQWLPVAATIDLETPRQHWRNIHHFSDYRKYRVTMNLPGAPSP